MTLAETRRRKNLTIKKKKKKKKKIKRRGKKEAGYSRKIVVALGDEAKGEGR